MLASLHLYLGPSRKHRGQSLGKGPAALLVSPDTGKGQAVGRGQWCYSHQEVAAACGRLHGCHSHMSEGQQENTGNQGLIQALPPWLSKDWPMAQREARLERRLGKLGTEGERLSCSHSFYVEAVGGAPQSSRSLHTQGLP